MPSKVTLALAVSMGALLFTPALAAEGSGSQGANVDRCHPRSGHNLLKNSGFEHGVHGQPREWQSDSFQPGAEFRWDRHQQVEGDRSVKVVIPRAEINDARWIQTVKVKPNTNYELSGWIRTKGVEPGRELPGFDVGANLSLLDVTINGGFTFTTSLFGDNDWTHVKVSFDSGSNTTVTVAARVGMYAAQATGTAWFDEVQLRQLYACDDDD